MERRKRKANAARLWAAGLCGIWLLGWGALIGACRDSVGTALYVTIEFPPSVRMDQLLVSGMVADSGIGPQAVPEQPERLLSNGDTFRVLLPSVPDKSEATLNVEGLHEGTRVAFGTSVVDVLQGKEVDITVQLEPTPTPDGGVPDGGTPDAGFCPDCANGCCLGGVCTTSTFNTCGSGGVSCVMCEPRLSNNCAAAGFCACGQGAACDSRTADQCMNGQCKCGNSGPCGFGQECVSGQCKCTPSSCSGCCTFNVCAPGNSSNACGRNGAACVGCGKKMCSATGTCI
ncbi:MAG: hypothetical protein ACJ8AT_24060 [Hyalangium sp.]|uniref:hypothetical protein n=1 Tax=Hyalangium sp. TaxID=2028555 RepID=UPI00389B2E9C